MERHLLLLHIRMSEHIFLRLRQAQTGNQRAEVDLILAIDVARHIEFVGSHLGGEVVDGQLGGEVLLLLHPTSQFLAESLFIRIDSRSTLVLLLGGIVHISLRHGGAGHLSIFDGVIDETASDIEVGGDDIHLTKIVEDDAEDQAQASHEKNADHE